MSLLFITNDPATDNVISAVGMGRLQLDIIHDTLIDFLTTEMGQEWSDMYNIVHETLGSQSISDLPADVFIGCIELIMQAIEDNDALLPYKEQLTVALQADPRFKAATTT